VPTSSPYETVVDHEEPRAVSGGGDGSTPRVMP
jgi:hypothetical protein